MLLNSFLLSAGINLATEKAKKRNYTSNVSNIPPLSSLLGMQASAQKPQTFFLEICKNIPISTEHKT